MREARPKFSPAAVCGEFAQALKAYRVSRVWGDHWGGEFVKEPFRQAGINYELADRPKSDLYRDALPLLNSGRVELLDHPRLVAQLCSLERRVSRAGKDSIDHPPQGADDVANAVCGVLVSSASARRALRVPRIVVERVAQSGRAPVFFHSPRAFGM